MAVKIQNYTHVFSRKLKHYKQLFINDIILQGDDRAY